MWKVVFPILVSVLVAYASPVRADTLTLFSSTPYKVIVAHLGAEFEAQSGYKITMKYGLTPELEKAVRADEPLDLVLMQDSAVAALLNEERLDSALSVGHAYMAVGVKDGKPAPDISSPDAFKQSLLAAKKVAYSMGSSGVIFTKAIKSLGIDKEVEAKGIIAKTEMVGDFLMRDEPDFGVQQSSELLGVKGIKIVGPLPGNLDQNISSSVARTSKANPEATKFLEFLKSEKAIAIFRANGILAN